MVQVVIPQAASAIALLRLNGGGDVKRPVSEPLSALDQSAFFLDFSIFHTEHFRDASHSAQRASCQ